MKTVLVTGCSTGFGREIACHFLAQGWNVVATMRDPATSTLHASERLRVLQLDVTDAGSIEAAVSAAGPIDVLVNNAGIGWLNALEGTSIETVRETFETNLFGAIALMQAVLPGFRERRSGAIVNIGSSGTLKAVPLLSVYRASKAAMHALTESLAMELAPFGISARVVVPGAARSTSFSKTGRARVERNGGFPEPYADFIYRALGDYAASPHAFTKEAEVAEAVFRAATDPDCPTVLPVGAEAIAWANGG